MRGLKKLNFEKVIASVQFEVSEICHSSVCIHLYSFDTVRKHSAFGVLRHTSLLVFGLLKTCSWYWKKYMWVVVTTLYSSARDCLCFCRGFASVHSRFYAAVRPMQNLVRLLCKPQLVVIVFVTEVLPSLIGRRFRLLLAVLRLRFCPTALNSRKQKGGRGGFTAFLFTNTFQPCFIYTGG